LSTKPLRMKPLRMKSMCKIQLLISIFIFLFREVEVIGMPRCRRNAEVPRFKLRSNLVFAHRVVK